MANPITILSASNGLNNNMDPARIRFDPKTGVQDLAAAYNVDHDETGRLSRRKGFSSTARTENVHSLFCDGGECVFATGSSLCVLNSDYSYSAVASVTPGAQVAYLQLHNRVYWANGFEKGYVEDGENHAWVIGTYVGPATTRQYYDPPVGTHLAHHGGRIFVIQGKVAWHSEPFNLNAFDLVRNYLPFQSNLRMFRPVRDGVWVSTQRKIYFLAGTIPSEYARMETAAYPAIEWTDAPLDLENLGAGELTGKGAIWTSTKGVCVGLPGGQMINLTYKKVNYPDARKGAGLVMGKKYVGLLEP